ncbi:hypothetical protein A2943_03155 [Candidatus Adlerbacteria bacterium RIFCSPLOWO2_01_FULL_51_16]|uniref:DUF454 domain-containing protein n=1 Tax=Candidatus Adlerbacteria bacterium RIFCSPLOWO2_01_FULL_51_16 TaxID=1797243 RepID=A0A1F4XH08_9BACT|nr:MAG: hypothetical protein A2943_03155 [Candidatus Adlerbacteria bacterium RIFCSPLOWO2_01_FULL_51_16]
MKYHIKRITIFALGIIFLVFGVLGLFLPFLQGFLFIAIGLLLLSLYSPTLREWVETHTRRWPKLHSIVGKTDAWLRRTIGDV